MQWPGFGYAAVLRLIGSIHSSQLSAGFLPVPHTKDSYNSLQVLGVPVLESSVSSPEEQVQLMEKTVSVLWAAFRTVMSIAPLLASAGGAGAAEHLAQTDLELAAEQHELLEASSWCDFNLEIP